MVKGTPKTTKTPRTPPASAPSAGAQKRKESNKQKEALSENTPDFLAFCKTKRQKLTATNTDAQKPKYFHFHDNFRPPYWGTWRRRSARITGRRPFGREESLNYEENSDEEWEEEEEEEEADDWELARRFIQLLFERARRVPN